MKKEVADLQAEHNSRVQDINNDHRQAMANINKDHEGAIAKLKSDRDKSTADLEHKLAQANTKCKKHQDGEEAALVECQQQKLVHQREVEQMEIDHKAEIRALRIELNEAHTAAQEVMKRKIRKLEEDMVGQMEIYSGMVDEYDVNVKTIKHCGKKISRITDTSKQRLLKMRNYKDQHKKSVDAVVSEQRKMQ